MKTGNFDLGYSVLTTAVSITDQIQTTFKYTKPITVYNSKTDQKLTGLRRTYQTQGREWVRSAAFRVFATKTILRNFLIK